LGHSLIVGVADGKIDTYNSLFVHIGNSIASTTANTNNLDDGSVVLGYVEQHINRLKSQK
jgi:hypothetical protein